MLQGVLQRDQDQQLVKVQPHLQWRPEDIGNTKTKADLPTRVSGVG